MNSSKHIIEDRQYFEDSTPDQVQAIKERVFLYSPNIVYFKQIPMSSPFSNNLMFDMIEHYIKDIENVGVLFDVSIAKVPDPPSRRTINQRFAGLSNSISYASYYNEGNVLIEAAARFTQSFAKRPKYSIHASLDTAIETINKNLGL